MTSVLALPRALLLCLFLAVSCLAPQSARAAARQPILVGSEVGFPPFADVDAQGRPSGFSVELFDAVAKVMGIDVEYRAGRWDAVWLGLQRRELDALPLVARLEERQGLFDYTSAHTIGYDTFFVRKGGRKIRSVEEARSLSIVVMRSDAAADALLGRGFGDRLVQVDTLPDAFRLLASGRHDAVLAPLLQGNMLLRSLGLTDVVEPGRPLEEYRREFAFAVQKGDTALRDRLEQGLAIVKATGEYDRIYDKWLGPYDARKFPRQYVYWGAAAAALVLAVLGLWTWTLRRQVAFRTRALENEIGRRKATEDELERHRNHLEELVAERTRELQTARQAAESAAHEATLGEARYRALFENMIDGTAHHRMLFENDEAVDFVFLDANPAFEELTGMKDVVGKRVSEVIPGIRQSDPALFERLGRIAAGGGPEKFDIFVEALGMWFSVAAYSPKPGEFMTVFGNITERKEAELAMARYKDRLEAEVAARTAELLLLNKELQGFSYAASHDMRGPLGRISTFSQMLHHRYEGRLDEEGRSLLQFIRGNALRLMDLIDDLLEHARIGQKALELNVIDLQMAVRAVLGQFAEDIRQAGAEIREDVPPLLVRANAYGLAQVLRNLVDNALKYSRHAEPPRIEFGADAHAGRCRLWIRDNGIGFDMAYKDRIFEIFRRLHTYEEFPGSGVGLALVHKAMERMGGRVWAESQPGQGATFFLELESADEAAGCLPPAQEVPEAVGGATQ